MQETKARRPVLRRWGDIIMAERFPPRADAAALDVLRDFAEGIAANYARYMLGPSDSETITRVVDEFARAHRLAANPATRTNITVFAKDQARLQAELLCRGYRNRIAVNRGVRTADKRAIHVTPPNPSRSRIAVPMTAPTLTIVGATSGAHTMRFACSMNPNRIAKPFGAACLQLFRIVADDPVPAFDARRADSAGLFSRNLFAVECDLKHGGKTATYFGRWIGRRGDEGPWSQPVSMTIAA
jgi:hypothetical protein